MDLVQNYYDSAALLERLTAGIKRTNQRVVFLVGSALPAPVAIPGPGVPGVEGVIEIIREEFDSPEQLSELEKALSEPGNRYQSAFAFLLGRRGQQTVNEVIKRAVWKARRPLITTTATAAFLPTASTSDNVCESLDRDLDGWAIAPGLSALARLATNYPDRFGRTILTTNFDPLLEVAIGKSGGYYFRTILHRDGDISQSQGPGCHVIHLHGYWYGSDTLHTPRQIAQPRPRLKASLASLIKGSVLVVSGYSGWDDTFSEALMEVVLDDGAYPEIIWTFNATKPIPDPLLLKRLAPGIDRGRVSLYSGVDCNVFFPLLYAKWLALEEVVARDARPLISTQIQSPIDAAEVTRLIAAGGRREPEANIIEGDEEDRPPEADIYVGRNNELKAIANSSDPVLFVTGIGGQGKSTLAAQYFRLAQHERKYDYYAWRDCKEEAERFENQIISLIEKLSNGSISGADISNQSIEVLTDLLLRNLSEKSLLLVLDNVDHYVDLELNKLTGSMDAFVSAFLAKNSRSRICFTCRPYINVQQSSVLSLRLEGLDLHSAIELFTKRGAKFDYAELEEAHAVTNGHAFWLDLWAAQIAKTSSNITLRLLLNQLSTGALPTDTLDSIWTTLSDREQTVLRALAETVRPETEARIGDYLRDQIKFNRVMRALRSLRNLNLIVVKPRVGSEDVLELHPLIREYIKQTFSKQERISFIDIIISFYSGLMGLYKVEIKHKPTFTILRHWTESAELSIEAGKFESAFDTLAEVGYTFTAGDFPGEYARVAKLLFQNVSWEDHSKYRNFDLVFDCYFEILVKLGRSTEYTPLLATYEATVVAKNARFINLCNLKTYMYWARDEYADAIKWGTEGKELKDQTGVDTHFSTEHNLALAQRDSGLIDPALVYFLRGRKLEDVIDADELEETRHGSYYGNIGRCLHLMGQIDPALVCYKKSAMLFERDGSITHVENKGFARKWIAELLIAKGEYCAAKAFLHAAKKKWETVCPPRTADIDRLLNSFEKEMNQCQNLATDDSERFCIAWIFGREAEFGPLEMTSTTEQQ